MPHKAINKQNAVKVHAVNIIVRESRVARTLTVFNDEKSRDDLCRYEVAMARAAAASCLGAILLATPALIIQCDLDVRTGWKIRNRKHALEINSL